MSSKSFHLTITTPDRVIFDGQANYLSVPGAAGYLGLLVDHAPLITPLKPGVFQVRTPGVALPLTFTTKFNGLFEFNHNQASVLLESADSSVLNPT
jgi:F-type H+-transporting ATPase subunit epsilon